MVEPVLQRVPSIVLRVARRLLVEAFSTIEFETEKFGGTAVRFIPEGGWDSHHAGPANICRFRNEIDKVC